MAERKYFVLCENNCKFESMTKEQILSAIKQAVETGEIKDVDAGFVTKLKEQNKGANLTFWIGTTAEYNEIETKTENCFYILTDDTTGNDLKLEIKSLKARVESCEKKAATFAEVKVNLRGGTVSCTDENGQTVSGIQNGNVWIYTISKYGAYTFNATCGELSETQTLQVDTMKQYNLQINYVKENFADNDWETIIEAVQTGVYSEAWKVGDRKKVGSGVLSEMYLRIIGKNHDTYANGGIAPFTFMLEFESETQAAATVKTYLQIVMHTRGDEVFYLGTDMHKTNLPAIFKNFPAWREKMAKVKKITCISTTEVTDFETNIFLLSAAELAGVNNYPEGNQYKYFENGNRTIVPTYNEVWTRTKNTQSEISYFVEKEGGDYILNSNAQSIAAWTLPAFCF